MNMSLHSRRKRGYPFQAQQYEHRLRNSINASLQFNESPDSQTDPQETSLSRTVKPFKCYQRSNSISIDLNSDELLSVI